MRLNKFFFISMIASNINPSIACAAKASIYRAAIGNHSGVEVAIRGENELEIKRIFENGRAQTFTIDLKKSRILIQDEDHLQELSSSDGAMYTRALKKARDLISYTLVPARYDWLVLGPSVLNQELSAYVDAIDQVLSPEKDANCRFYAGTQEVLSLTGGVNGRLGEFDTLIDGIWVRDGYEAVVSDQSELATEGATLLQVRRPDDDELLDGLSIDPSLSKEGGLGFGLKESELSQKVRSVICRPLVD